MTPQNPKSADFALFFLGRVTLDRDGTKERKWYHSLHQLEFSTRLGYVSLSRPSWFLIHLTRRVRSFFYRNMHNVPTSVAPPKVLKNLKKCTDARSRQEYPSCTGFNFLFEFQIIWRNECKSIFSRHKCMSRFLLRPTKPTSNEALQMCQILDTNV